MAMIWVEPNGNNCQLSVQAIRPEDSESKRIKEAQAVSKGLNTLQQPSLQYDPYFGWYMVLPISDVTAFLLKPCVLCRCSQ